MMVRPFSGVIYIDPFRLKDEPHDADYILITHDHYDHYSKEDINKVSGADTVFIVPEKMKEAVIRDGYRNVFAVCPGEHKSVNKLNFEAVAAYNTFKSFHPRSAGWCGYILDLDGKRIYVAGDTDITKEAKAVKCDIALVPIGGTYTMDAKKAAELINTIKPETAIPTHYGSIVGRPEDARVFAQKVNAEIAVEIKLK